MNNGISGEQTAGVVIAAGSWRREALAAAAGLGSKVALSRAATGRLVGGGNVATVTVDPHELATEVDGELHRNQRGSLPDLGNVLERRVFGDRKNQSFGAEGGCGDGGGEEEEENRGEEGEGSGGRHCWWCVTVMEICGFI